jgi:hypothetical protein
LCGWRSARLGGTHSSRSTAPYKLVGRKLDVYVYERTVQIYDGIELLVTYERASRKGQRLTRDEFYVTWTWYITKSGMSTSTPSARSTVLPNTAAMGNASLGK